MFDGLELPSIDEVNRQLEVYDLEQSLYKFTLWVFEKVYKRPFLPNWHHKTLCDILEDIHKGELLHCVINIPPRYTKTEI